MNAIGGGAGLYRLAAANQIDLHDYADGLAADTSLTDQQRSAIMMDELLAHMAEKKTVLRQKINEFIGAVRAWLREHGFAKLAEYGNTDLAHLLATARKSLAAKAAGRAGPAMPLFARGDLDVAGWTDKRIDHLMSAYAYSNSDGKTKAYAAWISPQDYLALTTENQGTHCGRVQEQGRRLARHRPANAGPAPARRARTVRRPRRPRPTERP